MGLTYALGPVHTYPDMFEFPDSKISPVQTHPMVSGFTLVSKAPLH